jgi:hypothetical protein
VELNYINNLKGVLRMKNKFLKLLQPSLFLLPLLAILLLAAVPVSAAVTYNYTGNSYESVMDSSLGNNLTASFTFDIADDYTGFEAFTVTENNPTINDITSWSVTSGTITLSSENSDYEAGASFRFDNGVIAEWYFAVGENPGYYLASYNSTAYGVFDSGINYYNGTSNEVSGKPGTWSAPVPIPPSLFLLGSGLAGLAGFRKRFFVK